MGRVMTGSNFYDREEETQRAWRWLEEKHLLLLAPRRVGKTSLMRHLQRLADLQKPQNMAVVYAVVAGAKDEMAFVQKIYQAVAESPDGELMPRLLERLKGSRLARLLKHIESLSAFELEVVFRELPVQEWETLGEELTRFLNGLDKRWVIMVDELPIFVMNLLRQDETVERARHFLHWFRELRQNVTGRDNLRWLLAGSIGLDSITSRYRIGDTINDLRPFPLGPFSAETADRFLAKLAADKGMELSPAMRERICEAVGWLIPYHLQIFFDELEEIWREEGVAPTFPTANRVVENLLSPSRRLYFDYWNQRLQEELGAAEAGWARSLLKAAARDPQGATRTTLAQVLGRAINNANRREEMLGWLLDVLENDGYLVVENERYRFRSGLLREFWLRRFGA